jgi:hypothetical protein
MRFDIDEFNDNLTGHLILYRIMLVKNSYRMAGVHTAGYNTKKCIFLPRSSFM